MPLPPFASSSAEQAGAVVERAMGNNIYAQNQRANVNLARRSRLKNFRERNPIQHKNVQVAEDLPRTGWKVEFENGASDSAISPDMPSYFLTSPHFEIATHETTAPLGKDNHNYQHQQGMATTVNMTNSAGEVKVLDDAAISEDAPLWWRGAGGHTIVTRNLGYKKRDAIVKRQEGKMNNFMQGNGERNPVHHRWPKSEPMSYKVTGDGGVKVDFGENGPSDSAISADLPDYFLTSKHYEVVTHKPTDGRMADVAKWNMEGSTYGLKASVNTGDKVLDDSAISGDMPEWCVRASKEVNPMYLRRSNRSVTPRVHIANLETKEAEVTSRKIDVNSPAYRQKKKMQSSSVPLQWGMPGDTCKPSRTMQRSASEIISPIKKSNCAGLSVQFHSNGISVREGDRSAARNHRSPEKVNWEAQEGPPRWVGPKSGHSSFTTSSFHVYEKQPPASKSSQFLPYDHRSAHRTGWVPPPRERSKGVDGIWAAGYRKWD